METTLVGRKKSGRAKAILWFAAYSIFLIVGAMAFTSSGKGLNASLRFLGQVAFFTSPLVLSYSIYFSIKKKVSKTLILFCIFILPALFLILFELLISLVAN